jgi:hypothetical protein
MYEYLFCFLADGVAQEKTGHRPGARHALMLWITAPDEDKARLRGADAIEKKGWLLPRIKRGKRVDDPDLIDDDILRSAAERALADGSSIVVYKDEVASDA